MPAAVEKQLLHLDPAATSFTLTYRGQTTVSIPAPSPGIPLGAALLNLSTLVDEGGFDIESSGDDYLIVWHLIGDRPLMTITDSVGGGTTSSVTQTQAGLEPVKERISKNVLATLATIDGTGTWVSAYTVERRKRGEGNKPRANLIVMFEPENRSEFSVTGNNEGSHFKLADYTLLVFLQQSDEAGPAIDTLLNVAAAEIELALMADFQRGGLAGDTFITGYTPFDEGEGGWAGLVFEFTVKYATDYEDPYVLGT